MMKKFTFLALACMLMGVFSAQAQFTQSFDVVETPAGWTVINLAGPETWQFGPLPTDASPSNDGIEPHSGAGVAYITWSQGHNDYLITPQFTVAVGASDQVRFYSRNWGTSSGLTSSDMFNVELSTTGTAAEDFTVVLESDVVPPTQWTEYIYNLSEYAGQEVYIAVRAVTSGSQMRLYLDDLSVEAIPACPKPSQLASTVVSFTEVDLSWTENGSASNWQIVYGETGFDPNTGGITIPVNGNPTFILTGLSPDTQYDYYIRALCGLDSQSDLSAKASFYTGYCPYISGTTNRYIESFSTESGSTNISNLNSGIAPNGYGDYTDMVVTSYAGGIFDFNAALNFVDAGMTYNVGIWIDFDNNMVFDESENVYIDHYLHEASGTISIPEGTPNGDYRMRIVADGVQYLLTPCDGGDYGEAEDYTLTVLNPPTCLPVTNLAVAQITPNSAQLNWAFGYNESNWVVLYGVDGFNPITEGTAVPVSGMNSVTINELDDNTPYEFYVTAVCSESDISSPVGPVSFRTTCLPTTVPYTMDFEDAVIPALSECTSKENIGFSTHEWETANHTQNGFNGTVLKYSYNTQYTADAWFYTQAIELEAGTNYVLTYKYGNNNAFNTETMKIAYGPTPQKTGMTTQLISHTAITGGQAQYGAINFAVPTSGVYYFGFNAYSAANQFDLFLDDIHIDEGSMCDQATDIAISNIEETSATVSWTASTTAGQGYEVNVFVGGEDPETANPAFSGTYTALINQATITDLTANTVYDVYVTSLCGGLATSTSNSVSFTTDEAESVGVSNYDVTNISYFPNPVKDQLTVTAATAIESVTVYNLLGAAVMQIGSKDTDIVIDMSSLPAGAYILKASVAEGVSTFKVIKE